MAAMRLKLLPFLFVNFRYAHTFQIQEGYANLDNDPSKIEEHYRYYYPDNVFIGDIEFGWEF